MPAFFITATGTEIGKTLVTTALCHQLRQQNTPVYALKPIVTGWDPDDSTSDIAQILDACDLPLTEENIAHTNLYRFSEPISPNMAAAHEGAEIDFERLTAFCAPQDTSATQLIEGVGGAMVPLTSQHTVLDWLQALAIPTILVTGSYLGTLSHTLTTLSVLRAAGITIQHIIISASEKDPVPIEETKATLAQFAPEPITLLPRLSGSAPLYAHAPNLLHILEER